MRRAFQFWPAAVALLAVSAPQQVPAAADARQLAASVVIHRDEWGVPHIYGPTDASTSFGLAYAQAEDYFWQVEDTYLQALGRYAEVVGPAGLGSDILLRMYEVPSRSKADYEQLDPNLKAIGEAYV